MNVTLIATHQVSFANAGLLQHCAGVLALSASLKRKGIPYNVLDLSEFHHLYLEDFEKVMGAIVDKIVLTHPEILGFSTMTNNLPIALELSERMKKENPDIYIIIGGPGVSFCSAEVLETFPQVDLIIRGEADIAFPDWVEAFMTNNKNPEIKGLVYRKDGTIIDHGWPDPIDNLDDLPIPAYELWTLKEQEKHAEGDYKWNVVEVGRGCPFDCSFCTTSILFSRKFRLKSVPRIIEEVRYIREKKGNKPLVFLHDLLILDHAYIKRLCEALKQEAPGLSWKAFARLDTLNEEILKKLREAGCDEIYLGIEVGTEKMQKILHKNLDLGKFDEIIRILKKLDFKLGLSFILGIPGEDSADVISLFTLAMNARVLLMDNVNFGFGLLEPGRAPLFYETYKEILRYDEYGSYPYVDIPVSWTKWEQTIKKYPGIFTSYYHYHISERQRTDSLKYGMLGLAVNKFMKNSLWMAYKELGAELFIEIINNIDRVEMPDMASIQRIDYTKGMESIRRVVYEKLGADTEAARKFDAVACYEIAAIKVYSEKASKPTVFIEAHYNPIESIGALRGKKQPDPEKGYYLVMWDEKEEMVKCGPVPPHLAGLFNIQ